MSFFLYSAEQSRVINSSLTLANITYKDKVNGLHTLMHRVMKSLLEDKSAIIVCPDYNDKKLLTMMLDQAGLKGLVLDCPLHAQIQDQDWDSLRQRISAPLMSDEQTELDAGYMDKKKKQLITHFFTNRYVQTSSGITWRNLLDKYLGLAPGRGTAMLNADISTENFRFDLQEGDEIRQNIADALFIYQREFELSDVVHATDLQTDVHVLDRLQDVTFELFNFKDMAQGLRDRYYEVHQYLENGYRKNNAIWTSSLLDRIDFLAYKAENLKFKQSESQNRGLFGVFQSAAKQKAADEKQSLMDELNAIHRELSSRKWAANTIYQTWPEDIDDILKKYQQLIHDQLANRSNDRTEYLKSINQLNQNDPVLEDLEYDMQALLSRMNESGIFVKKYELNTLSFKKQMEYISSLVYEIELIMMRVEKNLPYYQWLVFVEELDIKSKKVIRTLQKYDPNEWMDLFDEWYTYELLTKTHDFTQHVTEIVLQDANVQHHLYIQYQLSALKARYKSNASKKLDVLKKSNPELYSVIANKKKMRHSLTWQQLVTDNTTFLSGLFPVLILDNDELNELKKGGYNDLFYFEMQKINVEILQLFDVVFSLYQEDNFSAIADYAIKNYFPEFKKPLSEVHTGEKLQAVRTLTESLLSFGKTPEIFQMRNACIISFSTPYVNDIVADRFYDFGIKKIISDQSAHESLLGALLDDQKYIYIITENGLFHPEKVEDYLWQRHILTAAKTAGCHILDIDTSSLLSTKGKSLEKLLEVIHQHQGNRKTEIQNQLTLEFI